MSPLQKQFEDWANAEGLPTLFLEKHGFYESHVTDVAWQAWQASRAVPVVELPPEHEVVYGGYDSAELLYALDLAGVSYDIEGGE